MAIELKVPAVGESITEVEVGEWRKKEGDSVEKDEAVVVIESEKANVDLPAPAAGRLSKILKKAGETVAVGTVIAHIEEGGEREAAEERKEAKEEEEESAKPTAGKGKGADSKAEGKPHPAEREEKEQILEHEVQPRVTPAAKRMLAEHQLRVEEVPPSGPGGRVLKEDVIRHVESAKGEAGAAESGRAAEPQKEGREEKERTEAEPEAVGEGRREEVIRMSRLRRTVAERLVQAQQKAALLTTFNEVDMSAVIQLRKTYGEAFLERYQVKLGFMSFFVKAVVDALKLVPEVNAEVRGAEVVYRNYYDIGVAIGGGRGLVVPVLRNAERMSLAEVEKAIGDFAKRAKDSSLKLEELQGGTFTISNGGIYGSLLSTPIVNPPQSGILGMHAIQERPVAVEGNVVIRPMMYLALTYDHRIVDGREAVTFLKRVKDVVENPARLLIEV